MKDRTLTLLDTYGAMIKVTIKKNIMVLLNI